MPGLRLFKNTIFQVSRLSGTTSAVRSSRWRSKQLLILGYHGISLEDEHLWDPTLFLSPEMLRQRLECIRRLDCNVLPLAEGIRRLYDGTLPRRSIVLTFDDGTVDFCVRAFPIVREFGYPATVYWTTFYAEYPRPVPDVAVQYLLWKAKGRVLDWPEMVGEPVTLDDTGYQSTSARLNKHVRLSGLNAEQKDEFLAEMSERLGLDYDDFRRRRILQVMNHQEAAELVSAGIDLQYHTHRHRTPRDRTLLMRELSDNRRCIEAAGAPPPEHFCYPSGLYTHLESQLLREAGVRSAVTCDPGLASAELNPLELPRFIDTMSCDMLNFEAWLSGVPQLLPRRKADLRTA